MDVIFLSWEKLADGRVLDPHGLLNERWIQGELPILRLHSHERTCHGTSDSRVLTTLKMTVIDYLTCGICRPFGYNYGVFEFASPNPPEKRTTPRSFTARPAG